MESLLTKYPDSLATLCPAWSGDYSPAQAFALIGRANGKLYLLDSARDARPLVSKRVELAAMYGGATLMVRRVADWQTLPIHGPAHAFYTALGVEWVEVNLPFSGFYESMHGADIDDALTRLFEDSAGFGIHDALHQIGLDESDSRAYELDYSKAYCDSFADACGLFFAPFSGKESPREYNFETDRVFVRITTQEAARVHAATDKDVLHRIASERHAHRSGFISSYSPRVESWGPLADWDHNQLGTLIRAFWETSTGEDWQAGECERGLVEDFSGNGALDNWLCDSMSAAGLRAVDLCHYLRQRAERGAGYELAAAQFENE